MLNNPLLLVCLAIGCGAMLGRVALRNVSLGVAGVLFAGVIWGYLEPGVKPPDALATFGLALFVYAIGLSSSDFLVDLCSHGGWRSLFIPPAAIGAAFFAALVLSRLLGIAPATASGVFAGALTNTPSLAAATTVLGPQGAEATLGYALAYPLGVLIPIVILAVPLRRETRQKPDSLVNAAVLAQHLHEPGESIQGLLERLSLSVRFARCVRDGVQFAISGSSVIRNGDVVTVVGPSRDVCDAVGKLGLECDQSVLSDRSQLDYRRIFVSNPEVYGKTLRELRLFRNYEGIVTRVRRGDRDFIPNAETKVLPGDRLRVIAPREHLSAISEFLGDSYHDASEFDVLTFGLGLAMGIALGAVEVVLPFGIGTFEIGPVAGCLFVALALGTLGRTGTLTWHLPYGASMALRQLGLVMFLACAGIKAGNLLHTAPLSPAPVLLGALTTSVACLVTVILSRALSAPSWPLTGGILAGVQTQPAVLGFAVGRCGNERVEGGYAEAYPLSMLLKIVLVQVLLLVMK
ncbi:yidE/YbjL duplication [Geoanaerobacter pelophilus]|uniref:YidE/YbjL duplication n=1 Tax=Geoanaerobacter pelophilus TaxID=60036 RepID=A0ABQ0MKB2_9BACT|nr:TrkA C-terminal domain-containing protein [Geoanaerobacter pelophilus]GAW67526.1 yidE/YbjL duplication [Geoanaerobacter pelophilus]